MPLYELSAQPTLVRPALVLAMEGWVNAGQAGTEAAEVLAAGGEVLARFDSDSLYDYRANRPTIDFEKGVMGSVAWPELTLRWRRFSGRDVLVLTGVEPNWNWQRLGWDVADLALRLGVVEHVSLGGIPWAVSHTRPVTAIVTASSPDLIEDGHDHPEGLLRVPASAVSTFERAVASAGIPTLGMWARVPHYIGVAFRAAAVALLEMVAERLGVEVDLVELAARAAEQRAQLDAIVEARPDIKAMVEQLEGLAADQPEVSGEQIAAEIERFLRERGSGEDGLDR